MKAAIMGAWRFAARLDVAAVALLMLIVLLAAGATLPQPGAETAADPQRLAAWVDGLRATHGGLADWLMTSGAVRFFSAPLMFIPWAVLLALTLLCTWHRWRGIWRSVRAEPGPCVPDQLAQAPCCAVVRPVSPAGMETRPTDWAAGMETRSVDWAAGMETRPTDWAAGMETRPTALEVLRRRLVERGFGVRATNACLHAERHRLARPATLVTHLAVFLLLAGVLVSVQLGWRVELTVPPGGAVDVGHGSELRVTHVALDVERYPDGSIADYVALVHVQDEPATLRLNAPIVRNGVGLYLRGYGSRPDGAAVTLLAAYEPGYTLLVLGGLLLFAGLTVTFGLPAGRVQACLAPDGALHIGGWAGRTAYDFEREFADLVAGAGGRPC